MQTTAQKQREKEIFSDLEVLLVQWMWEVADYYREQSWTFGVDAAGKYLDGETHQEPPASFSYETEDPQGLILFRVPKEIPNCRQRLRFLLERVHQVVSIALIASVGVTAANKALKELREQHNLPRIKSSESWCSRKSSNNE